MLNILRNKCNVKHTNHVVLSGWYSNRKWGFYPVWGKKQCLEFQIVIFMNLHFCCKTTFPSYKIQQFFVWQNFKFCSKCWYCSKVKSPILGKTPNLFIKKEVDMHYICANYVYFYKVNCPINYIFAHCLIHVWVCLLTEC